MVSPLLANIALNGIEDVHESKDKYGRKSSNSSIRYADDMVIILRPEDKATEILERISRFLATRGMKVSENKTLVTARAEGFDFLGWHFKVQSNGKFRCTPSVDNFKKFRKKAASFRMNNSSEKCLVKTIVNCSNYGAKEKATRLAPIVRGWRNYHRFCKMDGSRFSLWHINHRAFQVFKKESKLDRYSSELLVKKAFPSVPYSENKFVNVKGTKSPIMTET